MKGSNKGKGRYKRTKVNILHMILKNLKIVLEISKVIKEILKIFW